MFTMVRKCIKVEQKYLCFTNVLYEIVWSSIFVFLSIRYVLITAYDIVVLQVHFCMINMVKNTKKKLSRSYSISSNQSWRIKKNRIIKCSKVPIVLSPLKRSFEAKKSTLAIMYNKNKIKLIQTKNNALFSV